MTDFDLVIRNATIATPANVSTGDIGVVSGRIEAIASSLDAGRVKSWCRLTGRGARGLAIHAETCPQYLLLTEDAYDVGGFDGAKYICTPPPRTVDDQAAICETGSASGTNGTEESKCTPNGERTCVSKG